MCLRSHILLTYSLPYLSAGRHSLRVQGNSYIYLLVSEINEDLGPNIKEHIKVEEDCISSNINKGKPSFG